ncbi:methyltransferase [Streptomyces sp. GESEQ-35]|uniref:methyltransferase n=1 Tax=Streptomyces sp. GESEQ-35 TaxID=2812657 RepID=UPI001B343519|nr:methyltransferase [Streptomyces sp. GESEQ-35]
MTDYKTGDQEAMMSIITAQWVSQIARTLAEMRVPDLLHEAPRTPDEIAEAAGTHPETTFRLMRGAVGTGLAAYDDASGRFTSTPLLDRLRTDAADSLRNLAIVRHWRLWGSLPDAVRTGKDQAMEVLGQPLWEYFSATPEEGELFTQGITELSLPIIREAVPEIPADPGETIVDLGGATGAFVLSMLDEHPGTTGILFELPHVVDSARVHIQARSLSERCTAQAGDFFESVPEADIYLLKFVLHDWDDEACARLLERCREAMRPGGRVVVVDMLIGPVSRPDPAALMDVNMLTLQPGRERDHDDLDRLFASAGLKHSNTTPLTPPYYIVEAVTS